MFWLTQDPEKVKASARKIADPTAQGHYFGDNLLTWGRNLSTLDDQPFVQAWQGNIESDADQGAFCGAVTCRPAPHITACSWEAISSKAARTPAPG